VRFFLSFLQSSKNHPIPAYNFWQYYIKNGIEEAGYQWTECTEVDWALGLVPQSKEVHQQWKDDAWAKTIEWLKNNPVDIFLSYLYPQQVDKSAIREIQKMGIPCVNFFCDNVREFTKAPTEFDVFDLNLVPEYKAIEFYKAAAYPYINLPMPMWIPPGNRTPRTETNKQITFIGSKDIQRQLFFETVIAQSPQLPLNIYGPGWGKSTVDVVLPATYQLNKKIQFQWDFLLKYGIKAYLRKLQQRNYSPEVTPELESKIHGPISFEAYNNLTSTSMITVGINRYPSYSYPLNKPNTYSRLRDIEATMLGACYLTEYTDGIEELYDIGTEIAVFKTAEDFIEKVNELQADHKKRNSLKLNGQKRALGDLSIPNTLKKIIGALNL
jgi:hypothetical protein